MSIGISMRTQPRPMARDIVWGPRPLALESPENAGNSMISSFHQPLEGPGPSILNSGTRRTFATYSAKPHVECSRRGASARSPGGRVEFITSVSNPPLVLLNRIYAEIVATHCLRSSGGLMVPPMDTYRHSAIPPRARGICGLVNQTARSYLRVWLPRSPTQAHISGQR